MKFQFKMEFELQNQEMNWVGIWLEFIEGPNLLGKKLDNSQKFYLVMIFLNVNLDGLTWMQNFEVTTQVAIDLIWKYIQIGFEFKFILKQGLQARNTVDTMWGYCRCIVSATVALWVSQLWLEIHF
jgi:hypothetical protein